MSKLFEDPSFDSQTKEFLTTPHAKFGPTSYLPEVTDKFVDNLYKTTDIVDKIIEIYLLKEKKQMKSSDGKKSTSILGIPKLDDANNAGGKNSHLCTLILTEGDSAKSMAIAGLSVVGRDNYGVFPLKGKVLSIKHHINSAEGRKKIAENTELNNIKKIMGLESEKVYKDVNSLRYGKILIMTDQDLDGSHIKGLIMNLFDSFWPSLLKIEGFLSSMQTPIVKVTLKSKIHSFYNQYEYEEWMKKKNSTKKL